MAGRAAQRGGQRDDEGRVKTGRVGRREVIGQQHRRNVGQRNARLRQPAELGDDAVTDIAQIGDTLGHQSTQLGEEVDELVDCGHHRARRGGARVDELLGRLQPGPILRQGGRRRQDLRRRACRMRRAVSQPGGDGVGCRGEAGRLRGPVFLLDLGRHIHVIERRKAPRPDHRSVLNSGDDRNTLQNRAGHRGGVAIRRQ